MPQDELNRRIPNLSNILVLLTLASIGCGGSVSSMRVSHELGKDNVLMEDQELDIGPVLESQKTVECSFTIVNQTNRHVKINQVIPHCTCTHARLDKYEIAPGEKTQLRFEADPRGRAGKLRFTCRVDLERGPSFFCSALATIYRGVEFEEPHVSLGTLERSKTCSFTKKLYITAPTAEKERYQIANLSPTQGIMDASLTFREERVLDNQILQKVYEVKVDLLPNATTLPGKQTGSLILTYTDKKGPGGAVVMEVSWMTPEHLRITPPRIAFGSITDASSDVVREAILTCSSESEPSFRITGTRCSHPAISVPSMKEVPGSDGRRYSIRIALAPSKTDLFFSESITISTNHPLAPSIQLPVIAYKARTRK